MRETRALPHPRPRPRPALPALPLTREPPRRLRAAARQPPSCAGLATRGRHPPTIAAVAARAADEPPRTHRQRRGQRSSAPRSGDSRSRPPSGGEIRPPIPSRSACRPPANRGAPVDSRAEPQAPSRPQPHPVDWQPPQPEHRPAASCRQRRARARPATSRPAPRAERSSAHRGTGAPRRPRTVASPSQAATGAPTDPRSRAARQSRSAPGSIRSPSPRAIRAFRPERPQPTSCRSRGFPTAAQEHPQTRRLQALPKRPSYPCTESTQHLARGRVGHRRPRRGPGLGAPDRGEAGADGWRAVPRLLQAHGLSEASAAPEPAGARHPANTSAQHVEALLWVASTRRSSRRRGARPARGDGGHF